MTAVRKCLVVGALLSLSACGLVAGVQDLSYVDPATDKQATEPAPAAADSGAVTPEGRPVGDDASTPTKPDPLPAGDAAVEASIDAGEDGGTVDNGGDDNGPGRGGCSADDFSANDRRDPNDARIVTFPNGGPPGQYSPRCMVIRSGQSVTWQGDFKTYPLDARSQNPQNPITATTAGNAAVFTFSSKGRYRYGSSANNSMRGAIDVRP